MDRRSVGQVTVRAGRSKPSTLDQETQNRHDAPGDRLSAWLREPTGTEIGDEQHDRHRDERQQQHRPHADAGDQARDGGADAERRETSWRMPR